jgi:hypothetical protein
LCGASIIVYTFSASLLSGRESLLHYGEVNSFPSGSVWLPMQGIEEFGPLETELTESVRVQRQDETSRFSRYVSHCTGSVFIPTTYDRGCLKRARASSRHSQRETGSRRQGQRAIFRSLGRQESGRRPSEQETIGDTSRPLQHSKIENLHRSRNQVKRQDGSGNPSAYHRTFVPPITK